MPSFCPELRERRRAPGRVLYGWPARGNVAQEPNAHERRKIIAHLETRKNTEARHKVDCSAREVALRRREEGEEDRAAGGRADAWDELEARFEEVHEEEGSEEGVEGCEEEGLAVERTPFGRHAHAAAEVPADTTEREYELEAVLKPEREEARTESMSPCARMSIRGCFCWIARVVIFLAYSGRMILTKLALSDF